MSSTNAVASEDCFLFSLHVCQNKFTWYYNQSNPNPSLCKYSLSCFYCSVIIIKGVKKHFVTFHHFFFLIISKLILRLIFHLVSHSHFRWITSKLISETLCENPVRPVLQKWWDVFRGSDIKSLATTLSFPRQQEIRSVSHINRKLKREQHEVDMSQRS